MYFEVLSNLQKTIAGIKSDNYSLTFMVSVKQRGSERQCTVHLSGTDIDNGNRYKWISKEFGPDTDFALSVSEEPSGQISEYVDAEKSDNESVDLEKVKYFHKLKQELTEKGLL